MIRFFRILTGLLLGGAVGAGVVLLFAPQSGEKTRQMIQDRIASVMDEGRQAAEMRRLELVMQLENLKKPDLEY